MEHPVAHEIPDTQRAPGSSPSLALRPAVWLRWLAARYTLVLAALIVLAAVFAPWLAHQNPYDLAQLDILDGLLKPGSESSGGMIYWLGTDDQGRDLVSAILYGARTSLIVGFGSASISMTFGVALGLFAAYYRGKLDALVMRLVDLTLAFPAILVALIILGILGKGVGNVVLALVMVDWAFYARAVRSSALVEVNKEYVMAAQCALVPARRIIFRHVLPNCLSSLMVITTQQIARAIAIEAALSFLGLGVPITKPSLGLLIANGYAQVISGKWWVSLFPGLALLLMIVVLNLLGEQIRKRYSAH
ncbi:ABC transporter permease [Paraburkholderia tropica]|uniref:ABC transporter permease n=1 Tax=Paraburkholderia tropica TaxID=92647 RepID=UPI0038BC6E47